PLGNDGFSAERMEFMPQRFSPAVGAANELGPSLIGPDKRHAEERTTLGIGPVEDRLWLQRQSPAQCAHDFKSVRCEFASALRHPFLAIGQLSFCRYFLRTRLLETRHRRNDMYHKANQNRLTT